MTRSNFWTTCSPLVGCSVWSTGYRLVLHQACTQFCLFLKEENTHSEKDNTTPLLNNTRKTATGKSPRALNLHATWKKILLGVSWWAITAWSSCFFSRRCKGRHVTKRRPREDERCAAKRKLRLSCELTTLFARRHLPQLRGDWAL